MLLMNALVSTQVVNVFALLSTLALLSVAFRIIWLAFHPLCRFDAQKPEYIFFNSQLGRYAVCLLLANLFAEVSGLIGMHWLSQRGITNGSSLFYPTSCRV